MASRTRSESDVMIIVDDKDMTFNEPSLWQSEDSPRWYGGSSAWSSRTSLASETFGSFSLSFQGTSIAFFGNTPSSDNLPIFSINIDSKTSSAGYPELRMDTQWYTSPILADEPHKITLYNLDQIDVDYAIITPGDQTPLEGTTLTVDDSNPEIVYHGVWDKQTGQQFHPGGGWADVRPLRDTTHTSGNTGDSFIFQFAGTSISVHGFLPLTPAGLFSVTFTLDGAFSLSSVFPDPAVTSDSSFDGVLIQPNCLFYKSPTLTPGNHSLLVNITGIIGEQSFIIDYLTYTPSFTRLSERPDFGSGAAQPKSPTTMTATITTANVKPGCNH
ncbi:hypothetical protein MPER_10438, partial [Moniliophthora perniciosa FA553]